MIIDWSEVNIFIKPGPTDMRKQINGLSIIIEEDINADPLSGSLYLFCNKDRRRLKILYWDRNGFCLWLKRLEENRFPWPKNGDEVMEITREQLAMLLDGIDFFNAHKKLNFSRVS
ncbi:MAG: IS66 family insertion sequence element accessory protein TnpB [Methanosarcinaceae archaeon]|nr:IS66 family insertion sequence element accessory protein TnpB [Methanosarcinaceae archaeon]